MCDQNIRGLASEQTPGHPVTSHRVVTYPLNKEACERQSLQFSPQGVPKGLK